MEGLFEYMVGITRIHAAGLMVRRAREFENDNPGMPWNSERKMTRASHGTMSGIATTLARRGIVPQETKGITSGTGGSAGFEIDHVFRKDGCCG